MKELEKRKKIRSLTWRYFIKKKVKEILITFGVIFGVVFLPYWIGKISNSIFPSWTTGLCRFFECTEIDTSLLWSMGFIELLVLCIVSIFLFAWLRNNWIRAEEKAEGIIEEEEEADKVMKKGKKKRR